MRESGALIVVAAFIGFTAGYLAIPSTKSSDEAKQFLFAGIGCKDVQTLMSALLENRLDSTTAMRVRQHIMECSECRRLMVRARSEASSGFARAGLVSAQIYAPAGQNEL